jgi:dimethylargininase
MRFSKAIVKTPSESLIDGLSTAKLGLPNYKKAIKQHEAYIEALRSCGLKVHVLPPSDEYPDSVFIEDTALLTQFCAIITNPGAPSRRGETESIKPVLGDYYQNVFEIKQPGTVEAGDIMMVGTHYYIGLSERTNKSGANQVIDILNQHNLSGSTLKLKKVLHLKTGVAYIENNNLVACGEFIHHHDFQKFNFLEIEDNESYAANCVWVNDRVLIPKGYPNARQTIEMAGYETLELDVSEFKKLDGGLSCLSLRF